jgi:hypothetical protein
MATTTFDTLKFANSLKAAGVPDKQAEAQANVLGEALAINFKEVATKDDLTTAIRETEQRLNAKIDNLAAKFDGQFTLLKWMIGLSISLNVAVLIRLFVVRIP